MGFKPILRRLLQMPMFTTVAIVTLAVGIGANTAMFSVIQGILLKPLPYPDPDRLIVVDHTAPGVNVDRAGSAEFLYFTYRDEAQTLSGIGLSRMGTRSVTGIATPEEVPVLHVTQSVLPLLGIQAQVGRAFAARDDEPGSASTVMVTSGYWKAKLGGTASAIGQRLLLNGEPTEIIGVLPDTFQFLDNQPALVLPLRIDRSRTRLGGFNYRGIARLKPGVTIEQANAEFARLIPVALRRFPPFPGGSARMFEEARLAPVSRGLKESLVGDVSTVLWVLMGTIGVVLLIACANVANLLLVRAEGRQQELAIRAALGGSWSRIARELLAESVLLGLLGGALGVGLAYASVRSLLALAPGNLPRLQEISIDGTVLLFTLAISIVAGLLFGTVPVVKYAGPRLSGALHAGRRTSTDSRERHRTRSTLVVVQVALALVLLVSSALMIRTFQALRNVNPGFSRPESVLTLRVSIPESQVKEPVAVARMAQTIEDTIRRIPGVQAVGMTSAVPMDDRNWSDPIYAQDKVYGEAEVPPVRRYKFVAPGLFSTLGQPMIVGRDVSWVDLYERRPVAVLSENLARELWGSPSAAIGKRVRSFGSAWREVIGVVGDVRDNGVNEPAPTSAYWPLLMDAFTSDDTFVTRSLSYVIRSPRVGDEGLLTEVSRAVWSVNPNLPLASVRTLGEIYNRSLARTTFTLVMLAIAGGMALLLGLTGIYGVISYSVSQRTKEIGIRMALGAKHQEVTRMFLGHGVRLAAVGIACGLATAFAATRLLSSLLFSVSPMDPMTYVGVALSLLTAAALASYLPALRATAVDPVEALRAE
jgi:putative ABC transport system permease protein